MAGISDKAAGKLENKFKYNGIELQHLDNLKENSAGVQELGQGIHALQDAIAHKGTDMVGHSIYNDMYPSSSQMQQKHKKQPQTV